MGLIISLLLLKKNIYDKTDIYIESIDSRLELYIDPIVILLILTLVSFIQTDLSLLWYLLGEIGAYIIWLVLNTFSILYNYVFLYLV